MYAKVTERLAELIHHGTLVPGEAIPSEDELARIYGVSRITIRRALSELSLNNMVVARQGRGTFVRDPVTAAAPCLVSFTEEALRNGREPGTRLLSLETLTGTRAASELGLGDDEPVHRIQRLRTLDGEPLFVSTAHLPARVAIGLTERDVCTEGRQQSIYALLRSFGVELTDGTETVSAVAIDSDLASLFSIEPGEPVVRRTCLLHGAAGMPVLHEESLWGAPQRMSVRAATAAGRAPATT